MQTTNHCKTGFMAALTLAILMGLPSVAVYADEKTGEKWIELGLNQENWESCVFGGDGEIDFQKDQVVIEMGDPMTGIKLKKPFPTDEFEIEFEANRLDGFDFFVGFTFPVGKSHCSLILGGWAGTVVGLSNINDYDASDNPTTTYEDYKNNQWYKVRLMVTKNRIAAWAAGKKIVDHPRDGFKFDIRGEMDASTPMGISAYQCKVAYRNIRYRLLKTDVRAATDSSKPSSSPAQ